jgi:putative NADH-flavin reductase
MRILIIGASQGTGALAAAAALARGHEVTAFARSPQKLSLGDARLTRVPGDFHNLKSVSAAVPGHDALIVTASATSMRAFKTKPHYF